jgi:hypothetical protein
MRLALGLLALILAVSGCAARPPVAETPRNRAPRDADTRFEPTPGIIAIDSDSLRRVPERNAYVFTGSVVARQKKWVLYADRVEVVYNETPDDVILMEATGKVRVVARDCFTATARQAQVYGRRILLSGDVEVSTWSVPPRFKSYVIEVDRIQPARAPCREEPSRKRRQLLAMAGEGRGDAEADVHGAGDPALAGQEARAAAQPAGGGAGAERVEPVGHQP